MLTSNPMFRLFPPNDNNHPHHPQGAGDEGIAGGEPPPTPPPSNIIYVFTCDTDNIDICSEDVRQVKSDFLTEAEAQKVDAFKFDVDKRNALVSRLLPRHIFALHLKIPHKCVQIERSVTGRQKPIWLCSPPRDLATISSEPTSGNASPTGGGSGPENVFFHFNVSHDQSRVVMAVSRLMVGIDVMQAVPRPVGRSVQQFFKAFESVFTSAEWFYIRKGARLEFCGASEVERFMMLWTMKESYIKAIGTGLYLDPKLLECHKIDSSDAAMSMEHRLLENTFFYHNLQDEFVRCVCVAPHSAAYPDYAKHIPPDALSIDPDNCAQPIQFVERRFDFNDLLADIRSSHSSNC